MKYSVHLILLTVICVSLPTGFAEAGGFQLNEHGARAMAQAGAFAARANDPSALFFNPAGISFLRGTQVMFGTTLIMPRNSFIGPYNLNSNQQSDMVNNVFFPSNIYLTHTFTDGALKGLAAGIGVVNPFGLGTEWEDDWVGRAITREATIHNFYVMPTVSYAFSDFIAVGAGVNIVYGTGKLSRAITNFDPVLDLEFEGSGTAVSWNAGVMLKPVDAISLGFSYRSETEITYEGEADFHPPPSLAAGFPGGNGSTTITNPSQYFAGIAWKVSDDFEVEFDYQGINWSSYDELTIKFEQNKTTNPNLFQDDVTQAKNYKDTYIVRLGGEYSLHLLGLKLRAGYLYDNNPVPDEHLEPLLPDANRHGLNIGFGIDIWSGWTLDVAYMHMIVEERETTKTSQEGGVYFDGLYRASVDLIGINFTYRWN